MLSHCLQLRWEREGNRGDGRGGRDIREGRLEVGGGWVGEDGEEGGGGLRRGGLPRRALGGARLRGGGNPRQGSFLFPASVSDFRGTAGALLGCAAAARRLLPRIGLPRLAVIDLVCLGGRALRRGGRLEIGRALVESFSCSL